MLRPKISTSDTACRRRIVPGLVAALLATVAGAHHSSAMFDQEHRITLSGTVRQFQWTNPHCYIQLLVSGEQGPAEEWSVEMGAPLYLQQWGWRPSTLKPGDKVTLTISPLRKMGEHKGGLVVEVRDANGKLIGTPREATP
jgi:hypothetical protein